MASRAQQCFWTLYFYFVSEHITRNFNHSNDCWNDWIAIKWCICTLFVKWTCLIFTPFQFPCPFLKKAISALFIPKLLFKLSILYLKFHKCQIPGPGMCLVLPIGADAHASVTQPVCRGIFQVCRQVLKYFREYQNNSTIFHLMICFLPD